MKAYRATQSRALLNEACAMAVRGETWKRWLWKQWESLMQESVTQNNGSLEMVT